MFRRAFVCSALLVCLALTLPHPAHAQSATGSIEGSVVDQSAALMPGVTITVVQMATGVTRSTTSDDNGLFRILLLPVGVYDLTADLAGFSPRKFPEVTVAIGQAVTLHIQMAVTGVAETVNVPGGTPVIETGRSQVSSTITEAVSPEPSRQRPQFH